MKNLRILFVLIASMISVISSFTMEEGPIEKHNSSHWANKLNNDGDTPLHCIVNETKIDDESSQALAWLSINNGANPFIKNKSEKTPQQKAIDRNLPKLAEFFEAAEQAYREAFYK